MRKTFPLTAEGKHPDRLLDATKHEIRKYLKRERRPQGEHGGYADPAGAETDGPVRRRHHEAED